jgi:hypothetical protein
MAALLLFAAHGLRDGASNWCQTLMRLHQENVRTSRKDQDSILKYQESIKICRLHAGRA